MIQRVEQTKEETIAMYMKFSKEQLAEMLWDANVYIDSMPLQVIYPRESTGVYLDETGRWVRNAL